VVRCDRQLGFLNADSGFGVVEKERSAGDNPAWFYVRAFAPIFRVSLVPRRKVLTENAIEWGVPCPS